MNIAKKLDYPTIIIIMLLITLFVNLGFWQLRRAEFKESILRTYHEKMVVPPIDMANVLRWDDVNYLKVFTKGRFDKSRQFLLDNQVYAGQVGYHVLTPFIPANSHQAILVNRGWIAAGNDRSILPPIPTTTRQIKLEGNLKQLGKNFMLKKERLTNESWPIRIQEINGQELRRLFTYKLNSDYVLYLTDESLQKYGFQKDWKPVTVMPQKHYGYAVQWFGLAGAILIIALVRFFRKKA